MSLKDDKKSVFTAIGAYTSFMKKIDGADSTNIFPSINNKKDIVPLLIDVLKVIVGTDALQELIGNLFSNLVDKIEPQLKVGIKKQTTQHNSGDGLPDWFKNTGLSIGVSKIDLYGKYKTNPNSTNGSLIYATGGSDFDNSAYNAIKNGSSTFGNFLKIDYDSGTDSFVFKPKVSSGTMGEWTTGFVNDITVVDKKEFMSSVMDSFYGSITANQNKTVAEVANELEINKLIEQLVDDNDTFELSPADYDAILKQAQDLINGVVYYDMGCGLMGVSLSLSGMTNLIASISGSTDPFAIGNNVAATLDETVDPAVLEENKETIKDNFFQKIIKIITQKLAQALTTAPQIQALIQIANAFVNNGALITGKINEVFKQMKIFLNCILKDAMKLINEYIYNLVIKVLIALLNPLIRRLIKEKINQTVGIYQSLIPGGSLITTNT